MQDAARPTLVEAEANASMRPSEDGEARHARQAPAEDVITYSQAMRPTQDAARPAFAEPEAIATVSDDFRRRRRSHQGAFRVYFANITRWTKMWGYIAATNSPLQCCDAICVNEHHLRGTGLTREVKEMYKAGWTTAAEAAVANPLATTPGPGHGGVGVFMRKHLHVRTLGPSPKQEVQLEEHRGVPAQWAAATVRLLETELVVCTLYLAPDIGLTGTNWATLGEVAGYLHGTGLPFLLMGDFNAEISELLPLGLRTYLGGSGTRHEGRFQAATVSLILSWPPRRYQVASQLSGTGRVHGPLPTRVLSSAQIRRRHRCKDESWSPLSTTPQRWARTVHGSGISIM